MGSQRRFRFLILGLVLGLAVPVWAQTSVEEGIALYRSGDYLRAESVLNAIIIQTPGDVPARTYRGLALLELERVAEAQAELEQAAAADPASEAAQIGLARVYTQQMRFDEAGVALQRAEQINPQSVDLLYHRGLLSLAQSQFAPAAQDLERTLELDPTRTRAHYYAGLAYNGLRRPDRMVSHFQTFLTLEPEAPEAGRIRSLLRATR